MKLDQVYESAKREASEKRKVVPPARDLTSHERNWREFENQRPQRKARAKENAYALVSAITPVIRRLTADNIEVQLTQPEDEEWVLAATYYRFLQRPWYEGSKLFIGAYAAARCTITAEGYYFSSSGVSRVTGISDAAEAFVTHVGNSTAVGLSQAKLRSAREWKTYREEERRRVHVFWSSWN